LNPLKEQWLRKEENIYKIATRYKLTKSLEKDSLENLFISEEERIENKKLMLKVKKSEKIQPFD